MTKNEWCEARLTGEIHNLKRIKKKFAKFIGWIDKDICRCEGERLKIRERSK